MPSLEAAEGGVREVGRQDRGGEEQGRDRPGQVEREGDGRSREQEQPGGDEPHEGAGA